jgi:hypothetical protein
VLVPLCYLLAAVLLTWRLWENPARRIVFGNPHDADLFAWFMRYAATAVRHGRLPALITTGMNAPTGINLMWNTAMLLPGVLLAPVTGLAGPQLSLTIIATVGFAGSATALFLVLRRWDVSLPAAALAGAVYGFSPALLQTTRSHYDLELAILPPLIVSACARLAVGPRVPASRPAGAPVRWPTRWLARVPAWTKTGVWLGLLVAAQVFVMEETALTTAMTAVLVVLVLAVSRPRTVIRRLLPTAAGLVIAAAVALALTGSAFWTQFHGPLVVHGSSHPLNLYVNGLTSFVTPQGALLFHTAASAAAAARSKAGLAEYLGYLGWPLIGALAVAAVVSWRRLAGRVAAVTLVVLCMLSMGGHPLIGHRYYRAVDLPWYWIEKIPIFAPVLTDRLSILADGAAATLLAVGIDEGRRLLAAHWPARPMPRWPARLAQPMVLALAVICCLPLLPRPLLDARTPPLPKGWSAIFARLHLAPDSRVLVLPFPRPSETLPLRWVADSGEPSVMIGGYFVGPGKDGQARLGPYMSQRLPEYLDYLWSEGIPRGSPYFPEADIALQEWTGQDQGWATPHAPAARALMAGWRPQAIVADATVSSALGSYLVLILGPPTVQVDGLIGWRHPALTGPQALRVPGGTCTSARLQIARLVLWGLSGYSQAQFSGRAHTVRVLCAAERKQWPTAGTITSDLADSWSDQRL